MLKKLQKISLAKMMTSSHSKFLFRKVPQRNLRYLHKHAVVMGGVRGMKGWVCVKLDVDWVKHSRSKYNVLFRGI